MRLLSSPMSQRYCISTARVWEWWKLKNALWVLLGVLVGAGGLWFADYPLRSSVMRPTSPTSVSLMFEQAIISGQPEQVQQLMTPLTRNTFTRADFNVLRQYIGGGRAASDVATLKTYEVLTFGNGHSVTLWISNFNNDGIWEIQRFIKGSAFASDDQ